MNNDDREEFYDMIEDIGTAMPVAENRDNLQRRSLPNNGRPKPGSWRGQATDQDQYQRRATELGQNSDVIDHLAFGFGRGCVVNKREKGCGI